MCQNNLVRFIKELEALRTQFYKLSHPVNAKSNSGLDYGMSNLYCSLGLISSGIVGCIKWANAILNNDPWWGSPSNDDKDNSDTGTDRGPQDLRDDWPHAMPMPEEVRLKN